MIKYFLFDLGGVVVEYTNSRYYDYLAKISGVKRPEIEFIVEPYIARLEVGIITIKQFNKALGNELGISTKRVRWLEFYKGIVRINNGVVEIIRELHKNYRTAFLSNVDKSRYDDYVNHLLEAGLFDHKYGSCFISISKPQTASFRYVCRQLGVKPEEILFVDDRPENVYSAKVVGMQAVQFRGAAQLRKDLRKYLK